MLLSLLEENVLGKWNPPLLPNSNLRFACRTPPVEGILAVSHTNLCPCGRCVCLCVCICVCVCVCVPVSFFFFRSTNLQRMLKTVEGAVWSGIRDVLSGPPTGRGEVGVLEILGGWVSKHPPPSRVGGAFLAFWGGFLFTHCLLSLHSSAQYENTL